MNLVQQYNKNEIFIRNLVVTHEKVDFCVFCMRDIKNDPVTKFATKVLLLLGPLIQTTKIIRTQSPTMM